MRGGRKDRTSGQGQFIEPHRGWDATRKTGNNCDLTSTRNAQSGCDKSRAHANHGMEKVKGINGTRFGMCVWRGEDERGVCGRGSGQLAIHLACFAWEAELPSAAICFAMPLGTLKNKNLSTEQRLSGCAENAFHTASYNRNTTTFTMRLWYCF